MQSLADYLGIAPPKPEAAPDFVAFDVKGHTAQEFAEAFLNSEEFRRYLVNQLTLGELAPQIILRMMDYAKGWGKPAERVELGIEDRRREVAQLSREELIDRIQLLQAIVQELPEDASPNTVH